MVLLIWWPIITPREAKLSCQENVDVRPRRIRIASNKTMSSRIGNTERISLCGSIANEFKIVGQKIGMRVRPSLPSNYLKLSAIRCYRLMVWVVVWELPLGPVRVVVTWPSLAVVVVVWLLPLGPVRVVVNCAKAEPPIPRSANPRAQEKLRIDLRMMYSLLVVFGTRGWKTQT